MFAPFPACVEDVLAISLASHTGSGRSITAIGFAGSDRQAIEHAVLSAGARFLPGSDDIGAPPPIAEIVMIDVTDAGDLDAAMTAFPSAAQMIVRASLATVDAATALWPEAETVVGSDPIDLHLALASVLQRPAGRAATFDVASDEGLRLQRLADEIARIARTLVELPEGLNGAALAGRNALPHREPEATNGHGAAEEAAVTAQEVRAIIRLRRMRDRYFPAGLFADPAWDMLLDLAAARIERVRVAVSSLCIAAAVPPTTALRWIKAMTDKGLMRRVADPHDARRIFIQLSDDAALAMDKYLRAARGGPGQPV